MLFTIWFLVFFGQVVHCQKNLHKADSLNKNLEYKKNLHLIDLSFFDASLGYNYYRQICKSNYLGFRFGLWYYPSRGDLPLSQSTNTIPFLLSINYARFINSQVIINGAITQRFGYSWPIKENTFGLKDKVSYSDFSSFSLYGSYVLWKHFVPSIGGTLYFDKTSNNFFTRLYVGLAFKF